MKTNRDPQVYLQQHHWEGPEHAQWNRAFDAQVRCAQIDEDLFAARSVTGVLIAIVAFGAVLGALGVVLTMFLANPRVVGRRSTAFEVERAKRADAA